MEKLHLLPGRTKGSEAIAKGLARKGFTVFLGARDSEKGQSRCCRTKGRGRRAFCSTGGHPFGVCAEREATIESETGRLDVLVNNAGIGAAPGSRFNTPEEEIAENMRAVYETNVFAVVTVTNTFFRCFSNPMQGVS